MSTEGENLTKVLDRTQSLAQKDPQEDLSGQLAAFRKLFLRNRLGMNQESQAAVVKYRPRRCPAAQKMRES